MVSSFGLCVCNRTIICTHICHSQHKHELHTYMKKQKGSDSKNTQITDLFILLKMLFGSLPSFCSQDSVGCIIEKAKAQSSKKITQAAEPALCTTHDHLEQGEEFATGQIAALPCMGVTGAYCAMINQPPSQSELLPAVCYMAVDQCFSTYGL